MKINYRQNKKIVASVILIAFVMVTTLVSFVYIYSNTMKTCWVSLIESGYISESKIDTTVGEHDRLLDELSGVIDNFDLKSDEVKDILKLTKINDADYSLRMILKDGYGITEDGTVNDMSFIYDYNSFEELYNNGKKVSSLHEDKLSEGRMVFDQIFPIIQEGEVQGFLITVIDVDKLEEAITESSSKGRSSISIMDRNNGIIFVDTDLKKRYNVDTLRDSMIVKGYSFDEWKSGIIKGIESRTAVYDHETGKTFYMYSLPVRNTDWIVSVKLDEEIAFANVYFIRTVFYTLSLCEIMAFSFYILWNFKETKRQIEAENREYSEIAKALSGSYEMIYYVDIVDETYSEINKTGDSNNLGIICTGKHFFAECVENLRRIAYKDDLEMLLNFVNKDNIMNEFKFGENISREYRLMVNQNPVYYRMKVVKSNTDGNHIIIAVENIDSDVRADKEKQKMLEKAVQAANSASRAKTVFLNNMSHDIRTPMNAIIGFTELASAHINNTEQVKTYLNKINQSSEHLLSLINDVLDMSRIESGKVTINEKVENIAEIIHVLHGIVQTDISNKHIDFRIECYDVEHEKIICDKLRLNQALLNILSNAIKYTSEYGTIDFCVTEKKSDDNMHAYFEFKIKDNGMGMSTEFLEKIYDPFTREKSSTVSGIQGTGLGMAITRNIVNLMNGNIDIKSEENVGTEVTLSFVFKKEDTEEQFIDMNYIKSVVIDSNKASSEAISNLLLSMNMNVTSYSDNIDEDEIESIIKKKQFDLIIVDWAPKIKGRFKYISKIKEVASCEAKIVIVSAYDWSEIENDINNLNGVLVLPKPIFKSDIIKIFEKNEISNTENKNEKVLVPVVGKHILLVEDNELNREIALDILHDSGFIVDTAEDGTVAVEKLSKASKGAYDLILMDIQMPLMDGYEATKRIRALRNRDVARIPIIAMTANAFEEDKKLAEEAGMNAHLAKPIDIAVFMKTIEKYI